MLKRTIEKYIYITETYCEYLIPIIENNIAHFKTQEYPSTKKLMSVDVYKPTGRNIKGIYFLKIGTGIYYEYKYQGTRRI